MGLTIKNRLPAALAVALAVWSLRVALVGDLATGVPYADQWYREGLVVYEPWITGQFSWSAIFAPHNEHRIVWTHLWNIGLFELCGQWDPIVQMVAQAAIPGFVAGACVFGLVAVYRDWLWRCAIILGAVMTFASPLSHENILGGFQSQFGFLVALSWAGLAATALAWSHGRYAWLALLTGLAAPLAMAGGAMVGPIILAVSALVIWGERKIRGRTGMMLAIASICFFWSLWLRSDSPETSFARSKTVAQFGEAWLAALAWPNSQIPGLALLASLPVMIWLRQVLQKRTMPRAHELFLLGVYFWAVACATGSAWMRGALGSTPPSRYCDFLLPLCWVNLLALLMVLKAWWKIGEKTWQALGVVLALAWAGTVIFGGTGLLERFFLRDRPALQTTAGRRLEAINKMLEGGPKSPVTANGASEPPQDWDIVMASQSLGPFLPPELALPFRGMTPGESLMIGPPNSNTAWHWRSGTFETRSSAMIVFVEEESVNPGSRFTLYDQNGNPKAEFHPSGRRIGTWWEWLVLAAPGRYQLSISIPPRSGDLGLILPRPMSAVGYWARCIAAKRAPLLELALVLLVFALVTTRTTLPADERTAPTE